ncbi:MAG: alpha/beta hydrolase [Actinobacteria bacterium]|nr:alpha/beta hydrolase [Actinomycetota bacterium]
MVMSQTYSLQREDVMIQNEPLAASLYLPESPKAEVVLIHGFTGSKEDFTYIGEILAREGFKVLTFDNRGQHESGHSKRSDGYSMQSLGRDALEITRYFGLSKPHLLGHSFGGLIAQQAVILDSSSWRSLTLICSGPGGRSSWLQDPQFVNLTNETKSDVWEKILAPDRLSHPRFDLLKKRWIASDALSTMIYRDHLRKQESKIGEIAKLGLPAHVIYGENDDAWPLEEQNQMARELSAELTVLPGCGHCPNEDDPVLTAQALGDFWSRFTS